MTEEKLINDTEKRLSEAMLALDEAIAAVVRKKSDQVDIEQLKQLKEADEDLREKLSTNKLPTYQDEHTALAYLVKYQARQVNLVQSVFRMPQKHPPDPSAPLHVVDIGSGAWVSLIAYAIYRFVEKQGVPEKSITFHGIELSKEMRELGKELWQEFGLAAKNQRLDGLFNIFEVMEDSIKEYESICQYRKKWMGPVTSDTSNYETWLLSVHALYEESKKEIGEFIADYHERNRKNLQYELITTDESKKKYIEDLWPDYSNYCVVFPVKLLYGKSKDKLPETTKEYKRLLRLYVPYPTEWWWEQNHPRDDAIWVRRDFKE